MKEMESAPPLMGIISSFVTLIIVGGILYVIANHMKITLQMFQKIALALSLVVVLNLLFNYGILLVYEQPEHDDFCGKETRQAYETQEACEAIGGEWLSREAYYREPLPPKPAIIDGEGLQIQEYCDATASCREQFEDARTLYNRNVFIVLVALGTGALVLGFFLSAVTAVSTGFLYGGLLSYFIANVRHWSGMNEYLRVIELAVVLGVLVALGYRKLKDKNK